MSEIARAHALAFPVAVICAGLILACVNRSSRGSDAGLDAEAATSGQVAATIPSASTAPSTRPPPPSPPQCRAISVVGHVSVMPLLGAMDAGPPASVTESSELPEDAWLDLDPGSKLTAKHPRSTRETTFTGPGRVRSCVGRAEEAWLAKGTFNSVPSSGERPGGEQWLVTPSGMIRYASANVEVVATPTKSEVKVAVGTAYVWTGDQAGAVKPPLASMASTDGGALPDGWTRLDEKHAMTLTAKPLSVEESARAGLERCSKEAKSAKDLATAVAGPDASLRQIAPRHVIARRVARAACDVAALRVYLVAPSPARDAMLATLKQAEVEWRVIRPRGMRGGRLP